MELIGVAAVVENMLQFGSDVEQIQSQIDRVGQSGTIMGSIFEGLTGLLGGAFDFLGGILAGFGQIVLNIAEYTIGQLLADAIEAVIELVGDLVEKTIEAGNEFQTLTLRLNNMNLDALVKSGMDYNEAVTESIKLTQEQLEWLQKLAAATPYDNADITNVYSLARSYGFADGEARTLTESIADFAAAMGLSDQHMERVVVNLGQMKARGKITSTEMRDLARGAFLPLDDILQRIVDDMNKANFSFIDNSGAIAQNNEKLHELQQRLEIALQKQSEFTDQTKESTRMANALTIENLRAEIDQTTVKIGSLGEESKKLITTADLLKEISKPGAGVPFEYFLNAFQGIVAEEPRFSGASEKMARTFKAASDNVMDLATSFGGLNIVTPILDVLGGRIADFMDQFIRSDEAGQTFTELGQQLRDASVKIGEVLSMVVSDILGLLPSSQELASGFIGALNSLTTFIVDHREDFVGWVKELFQWVGETAAWIQSTLVPAIQNQLIPFIRDELLPVIKEMIGWLWDHRDEIVQFFVDLGGTIANVVAPIIKDVVLPAIREFIGLIWDHRGDLIATFKDLGSTIQNDVVPFLRDEVLPAAKEFINTLWDHREDILKFLVDIGKMFTEDIAPILRDVVLPAIQEFIGWLKDHQEEIIPWMTKLGELFVGFIILQQVVVWIASFVSALVGVITAVVATVAIVQGFLSIIAGLVGPILSVAAAVAGLITQFEFFRIVFTDVFTFAAENIQQLALNIITTFREMWAAIEEGDLVGLGMAIIRGIVRGIEYATVDLVDALWTAAQAGMNEFKNALGISSPSEAFYDFGANIIQGAVDGVNDSASALRDAMVGVAQEVWQSFLDFWEIGSPSRLAMGVAENIMGSFSDTITAQTAEAANAMQKAAIDIASPMLSMPALAQNYSSVAPASVSTSYQSVNNYNLQINSAAENEPIIQDFNMLQSLAGV